MDWHHGLLPEDSLMVVPVGVSLQGHYGLPVSCERFCRSVTAGRLPACFLFLLAFEFLRPAYYPVISCGCDQGGHVRPTDVAFAKILGGAVPTSGVLFYPPADGCG